MTLEIVSPLVYTKVGVPITVSSVAQVRIARYGPCVCVCVCVCVWVCLCVLYKCMPVRLYTSACVRPID
jgi:hypothetical protein